jgi:hypothetical protein
MKRRDLSFLAVALVVMGLAFANVVRAQERVPVPDPVATGGGMYQVVVDGVVVSQHTTERIAQGAAFLRYALCLWRCTVTYRHDYEVRMGVRWVTPPKIDSIKVLVDAPIDAHGRFVVAPGDTARVVAVGWQAGVPYACDGPRSWRELRITGQRACIVPGGREFWGPECPAITITDPSGSYEPREVSVCPQGGSPL